MVPTHAAHGWRDTLGAQDADSRTAPPPVRTDSGTAGGVIESNADPSGAAQTQPGFRVQIAACSTPETAHAMVRRIHESTLWRAYVEHEPPY